MYEVTMPKLSDSMEEGKIIAWKVKAGDAVRTGDVLAEVESDKAAMELECFHDGVVTKIVHGDGEEVPVGEVIALIGEKGEEAPNKARRAESTAARTKPREKPAPKPKEPEKEPKRKAAKKSAVKAEPAENDVRHPDARGSDTIFPGEKPRGRRVAISPYARRLAQEKGIDYATIQGSGPGGRIVARDIEGAAAVEEPTGEKAEQTRPAKAEAGSVPRPVSSGRADKDIAKGPAGQGHRGPHRQGHTPDAQAPAARKTERKRPDEAFPPLEVTEDEADVSDAPFRLRTQARRVIASKHAIPHFYLTRGVEVSALMARKDELKQHHGATLTHVIILACVRALKQHPEVNRAYDHGRVIAWKGIHIGLAVDTENGLTVAVLRNAQDLSLKEIVERVGPLVERARQGKLTAEDRRHPGFTITNLGMLDVEQFEPIINPPSSITLAVASALPVPVAVGDGIRVGRVMKLTAACDHRIVDGATAARFMKDLRGLLEDPDTLLKDTK